VNVQDNYGYMPLHEAARNEHLDIVKILLEKGADINARNKDDQTPLELEHEEKIRSLLQKARKDAKETISKIRHCKETKRRRKNANVFRIENETTCRFDE
jgi:ankyrin repeat protein